MSSLYLIDTNVLSELTRKEPNPNVLKFMENLSEIVISVVTLEEIEFGIQRLKTKKQIHLQNWWNAFLEIPPIVLPVSDEIARISANLRAGEDARGRRATQADMLIAATALHSGRTLVTRNTKDFQFCNVPLLNLFSEDRDVLHSPTE